MARFSFPVVQVGALLGAAAMVVVGQQLGAGDPATGAGSETTAIASAARPAPQAERAAIAVIERNGGSAAPQRSRGLADGRERDARPAPATEQDAEPVGVRPRLAVIIDDVGHDADAARLLMGLPVTLSILPYAEAAPVIAGEAAAGREVFVHLPMEPVGLDDPGPGAITTALDPAEIGRRVSSALARVPGATGLNNHMGSRATRDAAVMAAVFDALAGRDLVFVDSLTHPASIAAEAASAAGIAAFDRDVFLDAPGADPAAQIDAALALARAQGRAIAIGHPYPQTLAALQQLQAKAEAAGVELVAVSALRTPPTPPS